MTILVIGVNHKTATVALREKVAFSEDKRLLALEQLQHNGLAQNAVILSTCNRTEIYLHNKKIPPQENELWRQHCLYWFALVNRLDFEELKKHLYYYENTEAVSHLMEVACGLDSLVLGEPQILGQVKRAFQHSEDYYRHTAYPLSSELSRLFQKTFAAAKRVRSETDIGASAVSVAYAACGLARQIFESFEPLVILLVGAGETVELVARHLLRHGAKNLTIANRTLTRAEKLVETLEGSGKIRVLPLSQLQDGLNRADIVISSTSAENILISGEMVRTAQQNRHYKPMLIVDIAVPRDAEESVGEVDAVYHYSVDDLQNIIRHNLAQRQEASQAAREIVRQECGDFFQWLKVHQFSGLIRAYRDDAEEVRRELLEKSLQAVRQGQDAEQVLQELSRKLTNKLLHTPTRAMQQMMKAANPQGLHAFSKAIGAKRLEE